MQQNTTSTSLTNLDLIKAQLTSSDSDDRRWALYELQSYDLSETLDLFIMSMGDENRAVRAAAADVLERSNPKKCTPRLVSLLGSPRIEIRNLSASVLVKYGEDAADYLMDSLNDKNENVRKFCTDILGLAQCGRAVNKLCQLALDDPDRTVAVSAVEALGKIGQAEAIPTLYQIIDNNMGMKPEAYEAIGLIGAQESVHYLLGRLYHEDPISTFAIVDALGNLGNPKAIGYLNDFISKTSDYLKPKVVAAVLRVANKNEMAVLIDMSRDFMDTLISELKSGHEELLSLVLTQLNEASPPGTLELFFKHIDELPASIITALIKLGKENKSFWEKTLSLASHPDDWVSYTAIEAFEYMPHALIAPRLKQVLEKESSIRLLAALSVCEAMQLISLQPEVEQLCQGGEPEIQLEATRILTLWNHQETLG